MGQGVEEGCGWTWDKVRVKTGKGHERQNQNPGKGSPTRSLSAIVPTEHHLCMVQKQQSPVKSGLWRKDLGCTL